MSSESAKQALADPLRGIRILDMATVLAAPFAASLCADLGAEVVKLELPQGGDTLRGLAPVHQGHALFWKTANRGKQGISLDVRKPRGKALFLRLIADFDVLVENFRTGTLDQWGLDMPTLLAHNPRLIVLRLTGFGQTGPYARKPGFARIFEAMSGLTHLSGEPDRPPQHTNYPMGDAISGLFGAFAIAAALVERQSLPIEQQRGQEIDLSATEALFRLLDPLAAEHQFKGQARARSGSCASYTAPSNVYQSADGEWITLVGSSDPIFGRLAKAMGQADLAQDPRFAGNVQRTQHHKVLDAMVAQWCASQPYTLLAQTLEQHEVPFSKVNSVADAMADPHMQARGAVMELMDPVLGPIHAPTPVPRFVGRAPLHPCVGPDTGQDNGAVYGRLGLGEEELKQLRKEGVV
jgi:crotonobetainyl-CoA:carnitine CoA-transferase CaiB-like acyl-CoA transferase